MDNYSCMYDSDMVGVMNSNIGRIVTIFTSSGGVSGSGFTGILVKCDSDYLKLITTPPSSPVYPFGGCTFGAGGRGGRSGCGCGRSCGCDRGNDGNPLGTVCVIPTAQIVSYCFNEI